MPTMRLLLLITGSLRTLSCSMCRTALARSSSSRQQWMPGVITSRAVARPASKLSCAKPLQTMSRSVTMPISRSLSPIGMAPMSCSSMSFASSVTGVSGLTQSTPLCIASLTFMADLRWHPDSGPQPFGSLLVNELYYGMGPGDEGLIPSSKESEKTKSASRAGRTRPVYRERQDSLQQFLVRNSVVQGRGREFLDAGDLRVGIGLDVIGRAVRRQPKIDAGITVKVQRAIDSLGD